MPELARFFGIISRKALLKQMRPIIALTSMPIIRTKWGFLLLMKLS